MKISERITKLRTDYGLSQEKLADVLNISRQAVQKWEADLSAPDLDNLVRLAEFFNVSTDSLLFDGEERLAEEKSGKHFSPRYSKMSHWETYSQNLITEFTQSMEEGRDVGAYENLFRAVRSMPLTDLRERFADLLFELVQNAPQRADYPFHEPSDLETIRALRPDERPGFGKADPQTLLSKLHGAWAGRVCGCLLGKPIEGIRTEEFHPLLRESGNFPLHRYILSTDITDERAEKTKYRLKGKCYADTVTSMPPDDDTNYTVLAGVLIDRWGVDFTPNNVADIWLGYQPKSAYCTAERVAFCNFVAGYQPPESAVYKNASREWTGAQTRGDYFGYINPGDPELAADMAWRDASISHIKNGIYGEMFASAMIAAAAVENDVETIIRAGLGQIPAACRLTKDVTEVIDLVKAGKTREEVFAFIHEKWDEHTEHGWCHTIPNAMIVAASLLLGGGDYGKSICMAVETGFDTDCNGATVGSVLGMRNGYESLPEEWLAPIHDTLRTTIFGVGTVTLADMAEKTMKVALR